MSLDFSFSAEHLAMRATVQRLCRDARAGVIGEGTSDIQRNIIARDLGFMT